MAKQRKKLLIVDGYNVLRSGSRYRNAPDEDYTDDTFNAAREMLINDVVNYAGGDYKAVIVFDGAKNAFSDGEAETVGGVRIVFSPAGQSADKVIEKLAHDARERQVETLVVTASRARWGCTTRRRASTKPRRWLRRIRWPPASTPSPSPSSKLSATERAGNRTAYSKVTVS